MGSSFPPRQSVEGYHDTALFTPVSPPGHRAFSRLRLLTTLDLVLSLPGRTVFDVAAGACFLAAGLSHAGREVTLNDLRPLDEVMRPWDFRPGTRVYTSDIFALSPENVGRFDIVLCTEVIEHVAHPDELIRHLKGFLNPGGHLVLTTPNGRFVGNKLPTLSEVESVSELERKQFKPDSDGHLFLVTLEEMRGLLEQAGLIPVTEITFGSPTISGYLKFRHLALPNLSRLWYLGEEVVGRLPAWLRDRAASHLLVSARTATEDGA